MRKLLVTPKQVNIFVNNAITLSDWAGEISKLANLVKKKISGSTNCHDGIRFFFSGVNKIKTLAERGNCEVSHI